MRPTTSLNWRAKAGRDVVTVRARLSTVQSRCGSWVTQAALPHLREQGSGHVVQISSTGGVAAWPLLGGYHATKWALEGLTESLAQEVSGVGIKVTLIESGAYATGWGGPSAVHVSANPAYDGVREQLDAFVQSLDFGDPTAAKARRCWRSSTPTTRRCASSSASGQSNAPAGLRRLAQDLGRPGRPVDPGAGRTGRVTEPDLSVGRSRAGRELITHGAVLGLQLLEESRSWGSLLGIRLSKAFFPAGVTAVAPAAPAAGIHMTKSLPGLPRGPGGQSCGPGGRASHRGADQEGKGEAGT